MDPKMIAAVTAHRLRRQAPNIAFSSGAATLVGAAVLACKSSMRLEAVIEEHKDSVAAVKEMHGHLKSVKPDDYNPTEYRKDVGYVYLRTAGSLAKLYGPAVAAGAVGFGLLTAAHVTQARRNSALLAAYTSLSMAYEQYRAATKEELGDEPKRAFTFSSDDVEGLDLGAQSPYARLFYDANRNWSKDPELRMAFLRAQENYMNQKLHSVGFVLLNEVYEALGMDRTGPGCIVGWLSNGDGDNYISFVPKTGDEQYDDFVTGVEDGIVLDFNVDGVIWDHI